MKFLPYFLDSDPFVTACVKVYSTFDHGYGWQ
jgi:hypothetical protein